MIIIGILEQKYLFLELFSQLLINKLPQQDEDIICPVFEIVVSKLDVELLVELFGPSDRSLRHHPHPHPQQFQQPLRLESH